MVAHQEIRRPVLRVVIRRRIFVLPGALVVGVQAEINVEPAIAIIVRDGRAGESSLRRIRELECVGLLAKLAAAFIQKQQRAVGAHHNDVLAAVIVEIGEQRARRIFQDPQAGRLGDVFERSVAAIAIETIGQAGRLANVKIVEAVVVDVSDRDSVVPVDVDARRAIEHGSPVVRPVQQLRRIGRIARRAPPDCHVHINRRTGTGPVSSSTRQLLTRNSPEADGTHAVPVADTLLTVKSGADPDNFVANASLHAARVWPDRRRRIPSAPAASIRVI